MTEKKKKIIIIGSIVAAVLLVVTVVTAVVCAKKGVGTEPGGSEIQTESGENGNAALKLIYAEFTVENSWENSGRVSTQYKCTLHNDSDNDISDWKIVAEVEPSATVEQGWSADCVSQDGFLTVTPVEYNSLLAGHSSLEAGFIITSDKANPIGRADVYINGVKYEGEPVVDAEPSQAQTAEPTQAPDKSGQSEVTSAAQAPQQSPVKNQAASGATPLAAHGRLSVSGTKIVDKNGNVFKLNGVSTHGVAWFPDYVNKQAFKQMRDEWGVNLIRIAMYTSEYAGYCNGGNKSQLKTLVDNAVNYCNELGMYVIIDWHTLSDNNPNTYKSEAISFFSEVSAKYASYENVLYEICNEPNGPTSWSDIKAYAKQVIPAIRANDKNAIIIVGTPTWSQDVDAAAKSPLSEYSNIAYALHFYAGTHKQSLINKATSAINSGLPIFVSEFSICDASGNGAIDYDSAQKWMSFIKQNNLPCAIWNLSNKNETSSLIKSGCSKKNGWSNNDLSDTGLWIKKQYTGA